MKHSLKALGLFFCLFSFQANSQHSLPDNIEAFYTEEPMKLDGYLSEPAWQMARKISNFTQRELLEGMPATERTEVAVVYTDRNLYIGIWCFDSDPDKIIAKERRRDFDDELDDNVKVVIDTYLDKRNGFMFITNPNGARSDLQVFDNGNNMNIFWNGVWDVRTSRNSQGWFVEMEIPFSTLKFRSDKVKDQVWGINFERNIRRKREQVLWQGWSRDAQIEQVNRAGNLSGLENLRNRQFVEFKPYSIAGIDQQPGAQETVLNGGGDINYLITPTYRLNVTMNTDFAQVESDRQQINLTRFPLFFPELREFFLEGQDYFDFGYGGNRIIPFYSRRIGLDDDFNPVPMLGGVRLLGKEGNSTMGLMSIQTGATETEPMTNYSVGSWRQDILEQSTVGFMTVNKITEDGLHTTTGGNFRYSTAKAFGNKNFNVGGAYIRTYNSSRGFERGSYAYRTFMSYPNDRVNIFVSAQKSPAAFNPEVGLMRRVNFEEYFGMFELRPRPSPGSWWKWVRQWSFMPGQITHTVYNDSRSIQSFQYIMRPMGFSTRSGEFLNFNIIREAEGLIEDFRIRENITIPTGEYWFNRYAVEGGTFSSRTFSGMFWISGGEFYRGSSSQHTYELRWRTSPFLTVSAAYEWNSVDLPQGSFTTQLIGNRLEYAFNPNLFGLIYTQWNDTDDLLVFNFRLQWIPIIGADFFFIVNHIVNTHDYDWIPAQTTVVGKLIWRFVL